MALEVVNCGHKKNKNDRMYFKVSKGENDGDFMIEKIFCRQCMKNEGLDK